MSAPEPKSAPTLAEIQGLFWRAITWPTGVAAFLDQTDEQTRRLFERVFAQTPGFSRLQRMEVYADAYYYRLEDVLREQFPVVFYVSGPVRFRNLCTDYVLEHPSVDPDVRRYGRRFASFVREHALRHELPFLGDLAEVDWAITDALDAPNETPMSVDALKQLSPDAWPSLRFRPMRTTRLLQSRWDFAALWRSMKNTVPRSEAPLDAREPPVFVLVWRQGLDVFHRPVRAGESAALEVLMAGAPFAQVCDAALGAVPDASPDTVARWLLDWLGSELIAGCHTDDARGDTPTTPK